MIIQIKAYTNIPEVYIDVFEFIGPDEKLFTVDSDSCNYVHDESNELVDITMRGAYHFDETEHYLNGQGEMLSKLMLANARLYIEEAPKEAPWFFIKRILVRDGEQYYEIPKENFNSITVTDDCDQLVASRPPLNKVEAYIELGSLGSEQNEYGWNTRVSGFVSLNNAKKLLTVYVNHLIMQNKIKDKLLQLKVTYEAYSVLSGDKEYLESDECRMLWENGEPEFFAEDAEYPKVVSVNLDRTMRNKKQVALILREPADMIFLQNELAGQACCVREFECIDGTTIDSSCIVSICK